jgi:hypothetical protein
MDFASSKCSCLRGCGCLATIALLLAFADAARAETFVVLDPSDSRAGYLASLLINEAPFPGERGYCSEADTQESMLAILWVLHSRLSLIPRGYTQKQVAGLRSNDIIDLITGTGGRRQCEGFYRDASGAFVSEARVQERIRYLLKLANSGSKPGRFTALLNYAQGLARAYDKGGMAGADRYAGLKRVGSVAVTGRAYSWMTDVDAYHPGGNFVTIPNANDGALGGNRFFTLRKEPK